MTKIRIYGLDGRDVVKTEWIWNTERATDAMLDFIAKDWKARLGCTRVFAMMDSKALRDAWFDFVRACRRQDGRAEMSKFEFVDYLESGDWELGK